MQLPPRSKIAFLLATALCISLPLTASARPWAPISEALSPRDVLRVLIERYRQDPTSFDASYRYLTLNHPELITAFLSGTQTAPRVAGNVAAAPALPLPMILGVVGAAGLAAAAGGGGSSGASSNEASSSPIPGSPPLSGSAASFRTPEYNTNWALEAIGAADRYAMGAQGQGVRLGLLDTGIDLDHPDFAANVDTADSRNYIDDANGIQDQDGHGTFVAGLIAGAKNDIGTHGVSFGSQLVVYRGIPGSDGAGVASATDPWVGAMRGSVAANVTALNNSWAYVDSQGNEISISDFASQSELEAFLGSSVVSALNDTRNNDLLQVFAAGNAGNSDVSVTAGIPTLMTQMQGYILAVGAVDQTNTIASFSNRCGTAMNFCLVAPGVNVTSSRLGGTALSPVGTMSGTSFAAPLVTGAAGVLKSQFPELTAPQISRILLDTADDLGAAGVDPVYGAGLLDLSKAVTPQGTLSVMTGSSTQDGSVPLTRTAVVARGPLAAALPASLGDRTLMVTDRYDRGYSTHLTGIVHDASPYDLLRATSAYVPIAPGYEAETTEGVLSGIRHRSASFSFAFNADGSAGQDLSTARRPVTSALSLVDPVSALAATASSAISVPLSPTLSLGFDTASGNAAGNSGSLQALSLEMHHDALSLSLTAGRIVEGGSVLGTVFTGAAGGQARADTTFAHLALSLPVAPQTRISLVAGMSSSDFTQGGMFESGQGLAAQGFGIGFERDFAGGTFGMSLSTPLTVGSGSIATSVPTARTASVDGKVSTGVTRSAETIALHAADRPVDLAFSLNRQLGGQIRPDLRGAAGVRSVGGDVAPYASVSWKFTF
ncbi:S8 family peptidase [Thioclava atlantica]|uniref:Serine protease n=1 Tax=Thioclava atlantica TaxID=1317124 RepID=A0A085U0G7_9RHOB|nr:S8 family peptidase [Thioclava atlantica]KFE36464.1 serine protease [Thioclava atlantica]